MPSAKHVAWPKHSSMVQAERHVVEAMTKCMKPDMAGLQQLVTPVGTEIQAADQLTQVIIPLPLSSGRLDSRCKSSAFLMGAL